MRLKKLLAEYENAQHKAYKANRRANILIHELTVTKRAYAMAERHYIKVNRELKVLSLLVDFEDGLYNKTRLNDLLDSLKIRGDYQETTDGKTWVGYDYLDQHWITLGSTGCETF